MQGQSQQLRQSGAPFSLADLLSSALERPLDLLGSGAHAERLEAGALALRGAAARRCPPPPHPQPGRRSMRVASVQHRCAATPTAAAPHSAPAQPAAPARRNQRPSARPPDRQRTYILHAGRADSATSILYYSFSVREKNPRVRAGGGPGASAPAQPPPTRNAPGHTPHHNTTHDQRCSARGAHSHQARPTPHRPARMQARQPSTAAPPA